MIILIYLILNIFSFLNEWVHFREATVPVSYLPSISMGASSSKKKKCTLRSKIFLLKVVSCTKDDNFVKNYLDFICIVFKFFYLFSAPVAKKKKKKKMLDIVKLFSFLLLIFFALAMHWNSFFVPCP